MRQGHDLSTLVNLSKADPPGWCNLDVLWLARSEVLFPLNNLVWIGTFSLQDYSGGGVSKGACVL
jgi:hypothetical protein